MKESKPSGLESLQSAKQKRLLDTVDKLRTCGLEEDLSLPQLVVCGDQSAGKSSVLEALTEINFPRADNLCTRFATEIKLRRGPTEHIRVKIIPDPDQDPSESNAASSFSASVDDFSQLSSKLEDVINQAKEAMGIVKDENGDEVKTFAREILSLEIQGPDRPQFTVVDLPGIFRNEARLGDRDIVDNLTHQFISKPRTICLAVIAATNDADNQPILTRVKEVDPDGIRSLGIITKPDLLPAGSGSEQSFIDLAKNLNKKYFFKLGWHVLKNRKFEESHVSFLERNQLEDTWFRKSNFRCLDPESRGIGALSKRLSHILFDHVKRELPGIRSEVNRMLSDATRALSVLGNSRDSPDERRDYLMNVAEIVQDTCKQALSSNIESEFFRTNQILSFNASSAWAIRRLGALVAKSNAEFSLRMRRHGHTFAIESEPNEDEKKGKRFLSDEKLAVLEEQADDETPISYAVALTWVLKTIERSRGRELEGNFNPLVISELYWAQSKRWVEIAVDHIEKIAYMCKSFMSDLLDHCCAPDVRDAVWAQHLEACLDKRTKEAHGHLQIMIESNRDHPINYNPSYVDTIQGIQQQRERARISHLVNDATVEPAKSRGKASYDWGEDTTQTVRTDSLIESSARSPRDMRLFMCEEALDCMQAIYKVKQEVFIDNVLCQVIRAHMLRGLEQVISPRWVGRLKDSEIEALASEPDDVQRKRALYKDQLQKLKAGQRILRDMTAGVEHTHAQVNGTLGKAGSETDVKDE